MREEPVVSPNAITFVGMDAHKKAINVAMLLPGAKQPVEWQVANEAAAIRRLAKRLVREAPGEVRCCYEAGPCGYALQRELEATGGIVCEVVAPSLIPSKPGDRIKTDRKDARKLAALQRGDLLTVVHPPTADEESVRDLCRCREDAQEDLTRARHRMGKFLLRRGLVFTVSKRAWGKLHRQWLCGLAFDHIADPAVFGDYLLAIEQLEERVLTLEARLSGASERAPYREPVGWLRAGRDRLALPAPIEVWRDAPPPAPRSTGTRDRAGRSRPGAAMSPLSISRRAREADAEGGRRDRAGVGRVPVGRPAGARCCP